MVNENICKEGPKSVHSLTISHLHWWQKERQNRMLNTLIYYHFWASMLILTHQEGEIAVFPDEL